MSILTKYICRRLILYFVSLVVIMLVFFIFIDFMEHIGRVTKHHASLKIIGLYYIYFLPRVFVETSWISFLIAMLIVFGTLAKNNELTAILAGGISVYRIVIPVFVIGAILSLGVFCVQEFVMPDTMLKVDTIKENDFAQNSEGHRIFKIAGFGRRNRFYFFDVLDVEQGMIKGLQINTNKGGLIVERIDAETAIWDEHEERWYIKNGVIRRFDPNGVVIERTEFSDMKAPFKESPKTLEIYSSDKGELNFLQLRQRIRDLRRSGYNARQLRVDYQKRFSLPLANLIVVFLAVPFALEYRRSGLIVGVGLSLMAALSYYGTFQVSLVLGRGGLFPASFSAWVANIVFLLIGAGLTLRART